MMGGTVCTRKVGDGVCVGLRGLAEELAEELLIRCVVSVWDLRE